MAKNKSDPSKLTTRQLNREVEILREAAIVENIWAEKLRLQRYDVVKERFEIIEALRVEQKSDTKAAVDAALTAQKEAVKEQTLASDRAISKSNTETTKQLEALNSTFIAAIKGVTDLLNDTKERLTRVESVSIGSDSKESKKRADSTLMVLALSLIAPIATVIFVAVHG